MKKLLLCTKYIFLSVMLFSQQEIALDDLVSPSLPAFSIIGKSTEEVSRPTDLRAVSTTIQNAVGGQGFIGDMGVEFNPFWMKKRRKATFDDYYNQREDQKFLEERMWKNIGNTSSFSIATTSYFSEPDSIESKKLGLGYRCQILTGKASDKCKELKAKLAQADVYSTLMGEKFITNDNLTIKARRDSIFILVESLVELDEDILPSDKQPFLKFFRVKLEECESAADLTALIRNPPVVYSEESIRELAEAQLERVGLIVELAGAGYIDFPGNQFELSYGRKAGAWLTVDYRTDNGSFDFILTARIINNYELVQTDNDFGFRINMNFEGFYLAAESIYRSGERRYNTLDFTGNPIIAVEDNSSWRYDLNFQYKLSSDITLSGVFGKDWNGTTTAEGSLLAQLGINLSFGKRFLTVNN